MGINWNPSYPDQVGVERKDAGYGGSAVSTPTRWQGLKFTALHTGPISHINIFSSDGSSTVPLGSPYKDQSAPMMLDLYPATGAPYINPYNVTSEFIQATAVTGQPQIYNENLTQPITVSRIQNPDDGLFLAAAHFPQDGFWVQFDTAAWPLNRRVVGVRVVARVISTWGVVRADDPPFAIGNHTYGIVKPISTGGFWYNDWVHLGEVLVDNNAPATPDGWSWWTPQMIRDMRSGGPRAIKIESWAYGWWCDWVVLQPFYTDQVETRIGVGAQPPKTAWNFTPFPMKTPAGTGTPSVVAGQEYVAILRKPWEQSAYEAGRANMSWRRVNGDPPATGWAHLTDSFIGSLDGAAASAPLFRQMVPEEFRDFTLAAIMTTGGPFGTGLAVETSQPYVMSRGAKVYKSGAVQIKADQTITVTGAANSVVYGQTAALVGWPESNPPGKTVKLRSEVWTATGAPEVRVFSPVERTFADIEKMPVTTNFPSSDDHGTSVTTRYVRFRHPESRMLPAGKYRIIFSTEDELTEAQSWRITGMSGHAHVINQTFGRTTDVGTGFWQDAFSNLGPVSGADLSGQVWNGDLQVVLMTVPPPVTGVATAVGYTTAHHASVCGETTCGGCADMGAPFSQLTWSASSDVLTTFYEVQRRDAYDPVFRAVAAVRGRFNTVWNDYEARIGIQSEYRIRSGRGDGVVGDWSDTESVSLPSGQIALAFTSNAATGLSATYPEVWEGDTVTRTWEFQEYGDVQFQPIYGREKQVAFHPTERRGVRVSRNILMSALCSVSPPTQRMWDPLRVISWAPIPYVCVRDGEGNRWFAAVQVPVGTNLRPGERWFADITVTEVSVDPAIQDTDVAQITVLDVIP